MPLARAAKQIYIHGEGTILDQVQKIQAINVTPPYHTRLPTRRWRPVACEVLFGYIGKYIDQVTGLQNS